MSLPGDGWEASGDYPGTGLDASRKPFLPWAGEEIAQNAEIAFVTEPQSANADGWLST